MKTTALLLTAAFVGPVWMASGQVLFSSGPFSYSQTFDTLASATGDNGWVNDLTLPEWYSNRSTYKGGTGSSTTGSLYSFGTGLDASDRALGTLPSNAIGDIAFGVQFKNPSATLTVTQITVTYVGEQWRYGGTVSSQSLVFGYKVGSSATFDDLSTGWTGFSALTFANPVNSGSARALNGNLVENRAPSQAITAILTGLEVAPGQELFLRWFDTNESASDHGLAVDDLTVTWVVADPIPEVPGSAVLLSLGALAILLRRQGRR